MPDGAALDGAALGATFFARGAEEVARALLGAWLISEVGGERVVGRVVETEAYIGPEDPASHAAARIGRTARNRSMFGEAGAAYVYRIYGLHWCLNVVTGEAGFPAAVLLRAVEPLAGEAVMRRRRESAGGRVRAPVTLAGGPARLAQAFGVTGVLDAHSLDQSPLWLAAPPGSKRPFVSAGEVMRGPRIGVTRAEDWPLRFWIGANPHVSR